MSQDNVLRNLAKFQQKLIAAADKFLKQEAEELMTESKEECPVDTGALRSSGYVGDVGHAGLVSTVRLGYGGVAAKVNPKTGETTEVYAVEVHEDLTTHHKVGKAKFLEDPYNRRVKGMSDRMAETLKKEGLF